MKKSILGSGSILRSKSIISFIMSNVVSYFHIWVLILLLNENGTKKLVQYPKSVVRRCTIKKVFLEISQNSQENTCARVCVSIKLQVWVWNLFKKETLALVFSCEFCGPATLLKKRLWHWCFPVNFAKFLRTPFLQNTYERLLLPVFVLDSFENTS